MRKSRIPSAKFIIPIFPGNDVIEVGHPCAPLGAQNARTPGHSLVHFGAIASGGMVALDDAQRQEFASQHGILAFDSEFNSVVESASIFGSSMHSKCCVGSQLSDN